MEVRGQQPGGADDALTRFRKVQAELAEQNRARVQRAREVLEGLSARRHEEAKERARAEQTESAEEGVEALERATKEGRARVERATESGADRIEISSEALAAHRTDGQDDERAARVEALRAAFEAGSLATPERVEQAAVRLLGGSEAEAQAAAK